jgi:CRP/FNR family transcriptional regulator, cyclic AMP receptor protein
MKHAVLAALSNEQTEALSRLAREVRFDAGESIFRQGQGADGFFLIETGEVNLEYELPGAKIVPIQKIGSGELLELSWLFEPHRWEFSATALSAVTAKFLAAADVRRECERDPRLGYKLMEAIARVLTERLQATRHKLRVFVERASEDDDARQVC